jgi:hypothetical protein
MRQKERNTLSGSGMSRDRMMAEPEGADPHGRNKFHRMPMIRATIAQQIAHQDGRVRNPPIDA